MISAFRGLPLATLFILMTVVIDSIGSGIMLPVIPLLISEVGGTTLAGAAFWGGILASGYALMQFVFSPILGNLSDRFGRRPVLLISLAVMALHYILLAVATSVWVLLFARIIGGMTGATMAVALAYMADTTPAERRGANFGLVSACFGLGFTLGPLIGGWLGAIDPRLPFYAAAAAATANVLLGWLAAPESLKPEARRAIAWRRANPVGGLMQLSRLPGAYGLLAALLLYQIASMVYPSVWAYFTPVQFGWDVRVVSLSLTIFGLSMFLVQSGLARMVFERIGESRAVLYGLMINVTCLICYGLTPYAWSIWALLPLSALGALVAPALQSLISQSAADDQQGEVQGVISSIAAIAMIISPFTMTRIFGYFTAEDAQIFLPGAPFLAASLMMFACLAVVALRGGPKLGQGQARV